MISKSFIVRTIAKDPEQGGDLNLSLMGTKEHINADVNHPFTDIREIDVYTETSNFDDEGHPSTVQGVIRLVPGDKGIMNKFEGRIEVSLSGIRKLRYALKELESKMLGAIVRVE